MLPPPSLALLSIFAISFLYNPNAKQAPGFCTHDILPLLPRQVSRPLLNSQRGAADLLPTFVGAANSSFSNSLALGRKGACFYNNSAWLELYSKTGNQFGGVLFVLRFEASYFIFGFFSLFHIGGIIEIIHQPWLLFVLIDDYYAWGMISLTSSVFINVDN